MANTLLTPTVIAKEALMLLKNSTVMAGLVHREFKNEFVKIGSSVNIRKPVRFLSYDGPDITSNIQDVTETNTSITIDKHKSVPWKFSAKDLTLTIEKYSERYLAPAIAQLANDVDLSLCNLYKDVFAASGTAGTTPSTFAAFAGAAQKLDEMAVPKDMRRMVLNPAAYWGIAGSQTGLFNGALAKDAWERGYLKNVAGFDIWSDQNVKAHTKGTATGTPLVNGSTSSGATTLVTDGWSNSITGILKQGDVFTIAGVNSVNPMSRESTGNLQQFTVTADANSNGTGQSTISIYPAITNSGAYQTVDALPADNAAITVVNTHKANLAFHKNAFALVTVPFEKPDSATWFETQSDPDSGLSVTVSKSWDNLKFEETCRVDIMWGAKAIYPELATRLLG